MPTKTLRGLITKAAAGLPVLIFEHDSNDLTRGWKVKRFEVLAVGVVSDDPGGILMTNDVVRTRIDFSDNGVIAWAGQPGKNLDAIVDPNHVIVSKLYITNFSADASGLNYLVELEEIQVDPTRNVIYQIKERSQNTPIA